MTTSIIKMGVNPAREDEVDDDDDDAVPNGDGEESWTTPAAPFGWAF
jgi:hypothetical protein